MRSFFTLVLMLFVSGTYAQTTITMVNYNFQPAHITITPGTKVTWVNKANMQHTSTSGTGCKKDGKWDSDNINPGGSFTYTFESEGTYNFFCTPHCAQGMTGTVEVKAAGKTGSSAPEKKK
jgi:manganese oxidase